MSISQIGISAISHQLDRYFLCVCVCGGGGGGGGGGEREREGG